MAIYFMIFASILIFSLYMYYYYLSDKKEKESIEVSIKKIPTAEFRKISFAKKGYFLSKKVDFPDDTFPSNMIFWGAGNPTLDATWLGRSIIVSLGKLTSDVRYANEYIEKYKAHTFDFIKKHFDEDEGAFKPNILSWSCLYGINSVLSILKQYSTMNSQFIPLGKKPIAEIIGFNNVSRLIDFVYRCKYETDDMVGFKETPYDDTATVVATDTALLILWNLEEIPDKLDKIHQYLNNSFKELKVRNGTIYGSTNFPGDDRPPCSSITRFALRSLMSLNSLFKETPNASKIIGDKQDRFDSFLSQYEENDNTKLSGILRLFHACKKDDGSFTAYPELKNTDTYRSDIYHTYSVISVIYFARDIIKGMNGRTRDLIEFTKIKDYINEIKADHGGYDLNKNGYKFSSIFGTRCAMEAAVCLKKLYETEDEIESSENMLNSLGEFLESCFDRETGAFFPFPTTPSSS